MSRRSRHKRTLQRAIRSLGWDVVRHGPTSAPFYAEQQSWLQAFASAAASAPSGPLAADLRCVVFSKDRAMQLHALLHSMRERVVEMPDVHVVHAASDDSHRAAYAEVFESAPFVMPHDETELGFRDTVLRLLESSPAHAFFLVDDIFFSRDADLRAYSQMLTGLTVPSLRHGRNITQSQIWGRRLGEWDQRQPPFLSAPEAGWLAWPFAGAERDWAFPLSLDGHLFQRDDLLAMLRPASFKSPNSLEAALQPFASMYAGRLGVCREQSVIVNNPCNQVQQEVHHSVSDEMSADDLLTAWNDGLEIDRAVYARVLNSGVHEELTLRFRPRAGADDRQH